MDNKTGLSCTQSSFFVKLMEHLVINKDADENFKYIYLFFIYFACVFFSLYYDSFIPKLRFLSGKFLQVKIFTHVLLFPTTSHSVLQVCDSIGTSSICFHRCNIHAMQIIGLLSEKCGILCMSFLQ